MRNSNLVVGTAVVGGMALSALYDQYLRPVVTDKADEKFEPTSDSQASPSLNRGTLINGGSDDVLHGGRGKDKTKRMPGTMTCGCAANDILTGTKTRMHFLRSR